MISGHDRDVEEKCFPLLLSVSRDVEEHMAIYLLSLILYLHYNLYNALYFFLNLDLPLKRSS